MDFLQGMFLGPVWAQTDYQDRGHKTLHFVIGLLASMFAVAYLLLPRLSLYFPISPGLLSVLVVALLGVLPWLASRYFYYPFMVKLLVLFAYFCQYAGLWLLVVKQLARHIELKDLDPLAMVGQTANNIMTRATNFFSFLDGLTATLVGVMVSALLMAIAGICFLLFCIFVPVFCFYLMKRAQRFLDRLVRNYLLRAGKISR